MNGTVYLMFLVAGFVVAASPGPTVLQIFAQSMSGDVRRPASLIAGSIVGNAVMVLATVLGVSALILASQTAFIALRWIGSGYLVYLGIHYWRMRATPLNVPRRSAPTRYKVLFVQGAMTSLTNPKGLAFYVAFLPQFVTSGADPHDQLAVLGVSYIGLCLITDMGYALAGLKLAGLMMSSRAVRLRNRITGTVLVAAGLSLLGYQRS